MTLPIWKWHYRIVEVLSTRNRLALAAPTGTGKSTQVPQMILDGGIISQRPDGTPSQLIVVEPRRIAARTLAGRVAWERGSALGEEVGYQIRFEDRTGPKTRIAFVTEGILLRWLQNEPSLRGVDAIVFDEFHERNLFSDVGLALVKRTQETTRQELRLVVMSATLDTDLVADYLAAQPNAAPEATGPQAPGPDASTAGDRPSPITSCPVLVAEDQHFPVEVRYQARPDRRPIFEQAAAAVESILISEEPGDILVFMPGMGEIQATIDALRSRRLPEKVALIPLHGELPADQQDLAFQPHSRRKVIVATNVAETSVTIDGIRHVVDSGLARVARFDAERGVPTLDVEEISQSSAEQRKGRAGRTGPGLCHRLWTENNHLNRAERTTPEIQRSDLAEVILLLHALGIRNATEFDWLDRPDPVAVRRAERLLRILGALEARPPTQGDDEGRPSVSGQDSATPHTEVRSDLTPLGRRMLRLPIHPRYSRMLLEAQPHGCPAAAALCAGLVSGRDLFLRPHQLDPKAATAREAFQDEGDSDFLTLWNAFMAAKARRFDPQACRRLGVHAQTARQIELTSRQILQMIEQSSSNLAARPEEGRDHTALSNLPEHTQELPRETREALLRCIMTGFIDQLCVRRDSGSLECHLPEGRQGSLMRESAVQGAPCFVAGEIREVRARGGQTRTLLGLASRVERSWLEETFPQHTERRVEYRYDRPHKRVEAVQRTRFLDLVIEQTHLSNQTELDPDATGRCLADAFLRGELSLPNFTHDLTQWIARVRLLATVCPELEFPRLDTDELRVCLTRAFRGLTLAKQAQSASLGEAFRRHLAEPQLEWLEEFAPTLLRFPNGREVKLTYPEAPTDKHGRVQPPQAQVRLHDCFGLKGHPTLCEGRLRVRLTLTSPNGKKLETTDDWPTFKADEYPKMKAALKRQYPGVAWL